MLLYSDFKPGLPVTIERHKADIVGADDEGIIATSVLPIGPRDSRHMQWTIPAAAVTAMVVYDGARDFADNGSVLCEDCGSRVRPRSLESLPEHGCTEREKARRAASQTEED